MANNHREEFRLFRDRLMFALKRASMSKAELARAIDTSSGAIGNLTTRGSETYRGPFCPKLANVLQVPLEWLSYNTGPLPAQSFDADLLPHPSMPESEISVVEGLSSLQRAALEALAALMRANVFPDEEVIDLLASLKPRLSELKDRAPNP